MALTTDYLRSCQSEFWRKVFAAELDYLLQRLRPGDEILSVGCGPAIIEGGLNEHGFTVVGLDVSREAIACAPGTIRTVVAPVGSQTELIKTGRLFSECVREVNENLRLNCI